MGPTSQSGGWGLDRFHQSPERAAAHSNVSKQLEVWKKQSTNHVTALVAG